MGDALEFTLNGRLVRAAGCSPNSTLLDFLRASGLTGSKEGCAEGDCGACSVVLVDTDAEGRPCYRAINSCLVPLCLMAGRELISVEGVGATDCSHPPARNAVPEAALHPVQRQMVECHGSQCGYCTPGFISSLFEGYYRDDLATRAQLEEQLCGNLCRCTGYRSIREAAARAFAERRERPADAFAARLHSAAARPAPVKYEIPGEAFLRPGSLLDLLDLRSRHPEGRLIAGATEIGLDLTKRYKKFPLFISVEAAPELKQTECTATEWRIGAAATLTQIEETAAREIPALAEMLAVFGSRQIRNRATMGGNLATASPIGDSAPVLLALDAELELASLAPSPADAAHAIAHTSRINPAKNGSPVVIRRVPIGEFFLEYRKTALRPSEILKTIILPRPSRNAHTSAAPRCRFYKVSKRREMDISTVAACFRIDLDSRGVISLARLAFGGVAATPARAKNAEQFLVGKPWNEQTINGALPILRSEFRPISDVRGDAAYRQGLIVSLLQKFYCDSLGADSADHRSHPAPIPAPAVFAPSSPLPGHPAPHESAHKHVTGEAMYTDDFPARRKMLETWPICAPHTRARILQRDVSAARAMPGIHGVLLAEDVPGVNDAGTKHDEPLFPKDEVSFHGQVIALVIGESLEQCRAAASRVLIDYDPLPPVLDLKQAVAAGSFHNQPNYIRRGNIAEALAESPLTLSGTFELGGQEHFYLETQAAWAEPGEDNSVFVMSSTQHPSEVQMVVAHALNLPSNKVVVQSPRMGGGFGGKETQAAQPAAFAALAAIKTGRPVRVRYNRDQDMMITGHRHPFLARFEIGFDARGILRAAKIDLFSNGGWAQDLSQAVTDRALFHLDNAYYIPAVEFSGRVAKTNLSSNTAFRGFGGPQGMLVIEEILDRVARRCGLPPELVRERNLYRGSGETNTTHYGQDIQDNRIQTIWRELKNSSRFDARRLELAQWNRAHSHAKRGIAITPVKFGISFTVTHLNQAGALVLIYQDGTVQINHGGTEMGQGLHTNVRAIASRALGVPPERVRLMPTSTDKIPNTSATAASSGTDLNGAAVQNACEILRERLRPIASALLNQLSAIGHQPSAIGDLPSGQAAGPATEPNIPPQDVSKPTPNQLSPVGNRLSAPDPQPQPAANAAHNLIFQNDTVFDPSRPEISISFSDLVRRAYLERISLSATGFYATPGIHWNRETGRGNPFHYFAYGAAVTEVEIDAFTGMHSVTRVDILHDVGDSINPGVNRGQIEGGFVQGMGWLTTEELKWDPAGRLLTHSPDTYKLPAIGDAPQIFNVAFLSGAAQKDVVHGSKAVGEPPLMLAISVREAIRDAVAAFGPAGCEIPLASPATCEAIFAAIQNQRRDSSNPVEVDASPLHNSATCEAAGRQAGAPGPRQPA